MEQEIGSEKLRQLEERVEYLETENSRLRELMAENGIVDTDYRDEALKQEEVKEGRKRAFTIAGIISLLTLPAVLILRKIKR